MSRRSTPAKIAADKAWPIRVYVRVPSLGFSGVGIDPDQWLTKRLGADGYAWHSAGSPTRDVSAWHSAGSPTRDVSAVYFRRIEDAAAFLEAFPQIELADET